MAIERFSEPASRPVAEPALPLSEPTPRGGSEQPAPIVGMSFPFASRLAGLLFWLVFPVIAVICLIQSVQQLQITGPVRQPGFVGTFTVTGKACFHGVCAIEGTFVSDNGLLDTPNLEGDPRWLPGQVHRVNWDGNGTAVFTTPDTRDPIIQIMALTGSTLYLLIVLALLVRNLGRRRPREPRTEQTIEHRSG